jgi:hypothetical protein
MKLILLLDGISAWLCIITAHEMAQFSIFGIQLDLIVWLASAATILSLIAYLVKPVRKLLIYRWKRVRQPKQTWPDPFGIVRGQNITLVQAPPFSVTLGRYPVIKEKDPLYFTWGKVNPLWGLRIHDVKEDITIFDVWITGLNDKEEMEQGEWKDIRREGDKQRITRRYFPKFPLNISSGGTEIIHFHPNTRIKSGTAVVVGIQLFGPDETPFTFQKIWP